MTASSAREVPLRERFRSTERTIASTAVGAASMRTSHPRSVVLGTTAHSAVLSTVYPQSHTDVVLGGAADSAVLSKVSRSTSRVRCSRALHVASAVLSTSHPRSVVLGCSHALHVASGHSLIWLNLA